jgi:hypothetical protein
MDCVDLLPAEPTVMVRSHIPGSVAILICSLPLKTMQSYCTMHLEYDDNKKRVAW